MFKCMNPGALGIALEWEDCLPLAKASGFEGIDVPIDPVEPASRYRDALGRYDLRPGGMGLPISFREDQKTYDDGLAALGPIAKCAAEVGVRRFYTWILPASETLPMKENVRFHVERLGPAADILAEHGCSLGLEFIGPKTSRDGRKYVFAHTIEQMLDLCEQVGPNAGLLLDSWHWYTSQATIEDILALTAEQVVYVHVNDAPAGVPIDQQQDLVRRLPGATGVIDLPGFLNALRTIGYDGPVVPEPFEKALKQLPPAQTVSRTGRAMQAVWSSRPRPKLPAEMKAVTVGGKKAWLVDLPVPRPQGNEVIVKLHASPLCGSNMSAFFSEGEHVNIGHEGAGEVVAVAHSNLLKVGDRVGLAPLNACGRCAPCLRGDGIYCARRPEVHGNFAQYTRVADVMCVPLPDDIDFVRGSLLGCGLGPAYEAIKRIHLRAFDTVVVSGLGPVGMGAVALARFGGARVIGIDPVEYRRGAADQLGAALTVSPEDAGLREKIAEAVGGDGVLKAIECSGTEQGLRLLIDLAGVRARIAIVGENQGRVAISPSEDLIRKGLTLSGCWHMNVQEAPELISFLRRAPEMAEKLISHRFGFGQTQEAFDTFASRRSVKVVLLPWE